MQHIRNSTKKSFAWYLSVVLLIVLASKVYAQENTITFDNQSGEQALVRLIGPTYQEIAVPSGGKKTVTASAGRYHIKVQYGASGKYRYTKGEEFNVTSSSTTSSQVTITLHKVRQGNYETKPIKAQEFEQSRPAPVSEQSGIAKITADKETRVSIPSNRTGIWVTAITGKGCENPKKPGVVFVLSEKEYGERNRPGKINEPIGETPILISNLVPGTYYVGVQTIIDEKTVGTKKIGPIGIEQPAFDDFFITDMSVNQEGVFRSKSEPGPSGLFEKLNPWYRKWYKVIVEDKKLQPVVALFLEKQTNPKLWQQYYPVNKSFSLPKLEGAENTLLNALNYEDSKGKVVPLDNMDVLLDLLARGGCVPLPHPGTGMVWINQDGNLEGKSRAGTDKTGAGIFRAASFLPLSHISVNRDTFEKEIMPKFQQQLDKETIELKISNPIDSAVVIGIRCDRRGVDFRISANGTGSVLVPNSSCNIFFNFENEKNALYQTGTFELKQPGMELQIVRVPEGIYAIRRFK